MTDTSARHIPLQSSGSMDLPRALEPFVEFATALRGAGMAVAPEQVQAFIAGVGLLGPRSIGDIRRAAHATFGPGPDRIEAFDAVFDAIFLGRALSAPAMGEPEDMPQAFDAGDLDLMPESPEEDPSGADATAAERLFARMLAPGDDETALRSFARAAPGTLPRRRSRRSAPGRGRLAD
ncbi:MAG: hypothetical protein KKG78_18570, partial [Alphaproteobacteria bacterium]|nr:hypothetical protein [Alphaproteobacteria bacterium]